jgi:branched-chain amino acid transport system permease protein
MPEIFGIPLQAFTGQLMLGLVNGSFYAVLALGLAVIFGLLKIVNFAHGAFFMVGAFGALMIERYLGIGYWPAILIIPVLTGSLGILVEITLLRRLYGLDPIYGLLLTFGVALLLEGSFRVGFGSSGQPYPTPHILQGSTDLSFMVLPNYRMWVVAASLIACLATWLVIEKTKLGSYLRAATERPDLTQAFGIKVPLIITLTYGAGVALAAVAGVLAAPILHVSSSMGSNLVITVFAIVVIGGLGSILGSVVAGLALGLIEGLTKVYYSEASATVIFLCMALVLLLRPAGLFGREER